jgi:hypothetical protein
VKRVRETFGDGREIEDERRFKEAESASHWQKSNGNGSYDLNRYKKWKRGVDMGFLFHFTIQNKSLQPISTLSKVDINKNLR